MAVLKADPEYRRRLISLFVFAMVLGYAIIQWGLPALNLFLKQKTPAEAIRILMVLVCFLFLSILPWSVYAFRYAQRILRTGQYPPAGTKVTRGTEIIEGEAARRKAHVIIMFSLFLAMAALLFALYFPYSFTKLLNDKDINQRTDKTFDRNAARARPTP